MAIEAHATARYVRTSAQKAGLVLDLIRGRDVNHALATLRFARKGVAKDIEKVLRSAIANAEHNRNLKPETLRVKEAVAGTATTIRRFTPKARGSAGPILKRNCHLRIVLSDE